MTRILFTEDIWTLFQTSILLKSLSLNLVTKCCN